MFDSIYSIALDILDKVHGQVRQFDSSYSIALAILDQIGGDTTKKFDSVYSVLKEIYKQRFGQAIPDMDSAYSIAEAINHALDDTDNRDYDSTYSILLHIDENPSLLGKRFRIITDPANTVIINGRHTREDYFEEGTVVTWSVSNDRDHYVAQSGTYTMTDEDYDLSVTLVREQYTVVITPDPADALVMINNQSVSELTADWGTEIQWSASKDHYVTQTGSLILMNDTSIDVTLVLQQFTFTVDTSLDNAVTINNRPQREVTLPYGSSIVWVVQREGYVTQNGSTTLTEDHTEYVTLVKQRVTFEITPSPVDATVLINNVEQSSITVDWGDEVSWSASATGYVQQSGTQVVTSNTVLPVTLVLQTHTFEIIPTPADSTVIINGVERTSITDYYGTSISWSVSHVGYQTQSGTEVLTETYDMPINLAKNNYFFEIEATPLDATIVINGEERSSITAPYETEIVWSVSASHYISQSGTYTLTGDHYETVTLARDNHTLTIVPAPADATVVIDGEQRTSYTAVHGTVAQYSVSREGYVSVSDSYTMDSDATIPVSLVAQNYTVDITTNVSDPTITWTIGGTTTTGSSITAPYGSQVSYVVSKTGYVSQSGSFVMSRTETISITMVLETHTFSIVTDAANTVVINGEQRTSITADYGTSISWSVSREHYVSQSGTYTLTDDHTETVVLVLQQFTLTINPTPQDSTVTIDGIIQSSKTVDYGTLVDYVVSRNNYTTVSVDDYPVTQTETINVSLTPVNYNIDFYVMPAAAAAGATISVDGTALAGVIYTGAFGTTHSYEIVSSGYVTATGSFTITGNATIPVTMQESATDPIITFNVTPQDATIIVNGQELSGNTYTAYVGEYIEYYIYKQGYQDAHGEIASVTTSQTITVNLIAIPSYTITFAVTPNNATIEVNGQVLSGNTYVAYENDYIDYYVSAPGYHDDYGWMQVTQDETINISLVQIVYHTVTFNVTPQDATIEVNGQVLSGNTYTGEEGDSIDWSVYKQNYTSESGVIYLEQDETVSVTLERIITYKGLRFDIVSGGTLKWRADTTSIAKTIQYSKDAGDTWTNWTATTSGATLSVQAGDIVLLRGSNSVYSQQNNDSNWFETANGATFYASGELTYLLDSQYRDYLPNFCFQYLFYSCTGLISNSTKRMTIHAVEAGLYCFQNMFKNCTGLTQRPIDYLAFRNVAGHAFQGMFYGCSNMVDGPDIIGVANWHSSTSGQQYDNGYNCSDMFIGCTSLLSAVKLPQLSELNKGPMFSRMYSGCTSLVNATPLNLTATGITTSVFMQMYQNCTSLVHGPVIYCQSVSSGIFTGMFKGCTSLSDLTLIFPGNEFPVQDNWLDNVASTGTIYVSGDSNWTTDKTVATMPSSGWTVVQDYLTLEVAAVPSGGNGQIVLGSRGQSRNDAVEYSLNGGEWVSGKWSDLGGVLLSVQQGDVIRLRGSISSFQSENQHNYIGSFDNDVKVYAYGNINSIRSSGDLKYLFDGTGNTNTNILVSRNTGRKMIRSGNVQCAYMFRKSGYLSNQGPTYNPIILLGHIAGYNQCLTGMFYGCDALIEAPELSFTGTFGNQYDMSCKEMFAGCTSLVHAPIINIVRTMGDSACQEMFMNCSSMTTPPPILPMITLAESCYQSMFSGCMALTHTPELPATTLAGSCYSNMFQNCTSLVSTVECLPAQTIPDSAYMYMYAGSGLTKAPEISATSVRPNGMRCMFYQCRSLVSAPSVISAAFDMTGSLSGDFMSQMFYQCTSLAKSPVLTNLTLASGCYYQMFRYCSNLKEIECWATDISADVCTTNWVQSVGYGGVFKKHPNMNSWPSGNSGIPSGWSVQDAVVS